MLRTKKFAALVLLAAVVMPQVASAQGNQGNGKPFQLGAESNSYNQNSGASSYAPYPVFQPKPVVAPPPVRHAVPQRAKVVPIQTPRAIQGGLQDTVRQPPPMQANIQAEQKLPPGVLPQQFLGSWAVLGSRTAAQGKAPQYQEALDRVMPSTNNQDWNIGGQPGHYGMTSSTGAQGITVSQCTTSTAFIRHEYPVGNCVAREAYVLQLDPSGTSFQGVMQCAVVKPGEPGPPRFSAKYNLMGRRK